jgi:hypothetical protein
VDRPGRYEDRIGAVVQRVVLQTGGSVPVEIVEDRVRDEFARWDEVSLDAYVPIFVERRVAAALGGRSRAGRHPAARPWALAERTMTAELPR